MNKCGDCIYFVRDGKCDFYKTHDVAKLPFETAPFWVWSDCYSDKEQVRHDVETNCTVFRDE